MKFIIKYLNWNIQVHRLKSSPGKHVRTSIYVQHAIYNSIKIKEVQSNEKHEVHFEQYLGVT
jgi:hypothetical protein